VPIAILRSSGLLWWYRVSPIAVLDVQGEDPVIVTTLSIVLSILPVLSTMMYEEEQFLCLFFLYRRKWTGATVDSSYSCKGALKQ
jgi:hypothetical protein